MSPAAACVSGVDILAFLGTFGLGWPKVGPHVPIAPTFCVLSPSPFASAALRLLYFNEELARKVFYCKTRCIKFTSSMRRLASELKKFEGRRVLISSVSGGLLFSNQPILHRS